MPLFQDIRLGEPCDVEGVIMPVLERQDIFGVDLTKSVLGKKNAGLFAEMIRGKGAVAALLERFWLCCAGGYVSVRIPPDFRTALPENYDKKNKKFKLKI